MTFNGVIFYVISLVYTPVSKDPRVIISCQSEDGEGNLFESISKYNGRITPPLKQMMTIERILIEK